MPHQAEQQEMKNANWSCRRLIDATVGLVVTALASMAVVNIPAVQAEQPTQLRILCYNVHHCRGIDGQLDVERIAEVIRSVQPDIVALQEIDQNVARSGAVDQPAKLAELTGMQVFFGANISLQGGDYGNAILSRLPIVDHKNHRLPNFDNGEQRGVIEAIIDGPSPLGRQVFYCTHLDHRADERERISSATVINQLLAKHDGAAAILAGDMNATPDSQTMRTITTAWKVSNDKPLLTIPVKTPTRQIDYILFSPPANWQTIEARVLDEAVASDHRAVLSVLQWNPQPQAPCRASE